MGFAADLNAMCARAGDQAEVVVRQTALELQSQMIERSPVGDPSNWLSNNPYTDLKTGKQKTGRKIQPYTGGRFKANWQVGLGAINTSTSAPPDKSGDTAEGRATMVLAGWIPGQSIWLTNSMEYAKALEYGHSHTQAPSGVVRLTVQSYAEALRKAIAESK